jgi:ribosomal protein L37AE/L43A/flavodoxin
MNSAIHLDPAYVDYVPDVSPERNSVPHCRLINTDDQYFINYMRTTEDVNSVEADLPILVRAGLESRSLTKSDPMVNIPPSDSIPSYSTRRITYPDLQLSSRSSVIYIKFDDVDFGEIASTYILKGTVVTPAIESTSVPSDYQNSCPSCMSTELNREAAWLDYCWHCSSIDTVSVDITAGDAYLQRTSLEYAITQTVEEYKDLNDNKILSFDLAGAYLSYDFYTIELPTDQAAKIIVEVTNGSLVHVDIMPGDCALRGTIGTRSLDCLYGFKCEVYTTQANVAELSGEYRIIISGEDVKGTIKAFIGQEVCSDSFDSENAPFCSEVGSWKWSGESNSATQKDDYADYLYDILKPSFESRYVQSAVCGQNELPDKTEESLKKFACQVAFPPCSDMGYGQLPDYDVCTDIEESSGVTFTQAGFDELNCNHNYFTGGVVWVGPGDDDAPIKKNDEQNSTPAADLLLILLIIPILVIILIIALIIYFVTKEKAPETAQQMDYIKN